MCFGKRPEFLGSAVPFALPLFGAELTNLFRGCDSMRTTDDALRCKVQPRIADTSARHAMEWIIDRSDENDAIRVLG